MRRTGWLKMNSFIHTLVHWVLEGFKMLLHDYFALCVDLIIWKHSNSFGFINYLIFLSGGDENFIFYLWNLIVLLLDKWGLNNAENLTVAKLKKQSLSLPERIELKGELFTGKSQNLYTDSPQVSDQFLELTTSGWAPKSSRKSNS